MSVTGSYTGDEPWGLNCRIPCHLFACHWIRIASIVSCFVLQRMPPTKQWWYRVAGYSAVTTKTLGTKLQSLYPKLFIIWDPPRVINWTKLGEKSVNPAVFYISWDTMEWTAERRKAKQLCPESMFNFIPVLLVKLNISMEANKCTIYNLKLQPFEARLFMRCTRPTSLLRCSPRL